jgi:nitrogen fixation protein NifU and related proteins
MFDDLNDLYQQVIIDHSKKPRNFRVMDGANRKAAGQNPLCGDNYTVFMQMDNGVVKDVSFQGDGCAISKASASLMTEALKGKSKEEAEKIFHEFHAMITEAKPASDALGKLGVLSGVSKFPTRVKCAILSWHAAHAALDGTAEVVSTENDEGQKLS